MEKSLQSLLRQEGGPGKLNPGEQQDSGGGVKERRMFSGGGGRETSQQRWIPGLEGSWQHPAGEWKAETEKERQTPGGRNRPRWGWRKA